jgi:hypothetical protein
VAGNDGSADPCRDVGRTNDVARIGVKRALNRRVERVFNLDRKDHHWGPRKLEERRMNCAVYEDCGWVCENHPYLPWQGEHACKCGGAGAPALVSATLARSDGASATAKNPRSRRSKLDADQGSNLEAD